MRRAKRAMTRAVSGMGKNPSSLHSGFDRSGPGSCPKETGAGVKKKEGPVWAEEVGEVG
jgi:hypothetical protein